MTSTANPAGSTASDGAIAASGSVLSAKADSIVFAPRDTNYELQLLRAGYSGPVNQPVRGYIRMTARKLWTVPSGGNFVAPIFGSPRTVQGRVRAIGDKWIIVQAGAPIFISLAAPGVAVDLTSGPVSVGGMVNVMTMPGATFEPV